MKKVIAVLAAVACLALLGAQPSHAACPAGIGDGTQPSATISCQGIAAFASGTNYSSGTQVVYQGCLYKANGGTNGFAPSAGVYVWGNGTSCGTTAGCNYGAQGPCSTSATATAPPTPTTTPTPVPGGVQGTPTPGATWTPKPTATATNAPTPTNAGVGCWAAWSSSVAYSGGAQVSRNNSNYQANWWTQGQDPASNNGPVGSGQPWTKMTGCGGTGATPTSPPVGATPTTAPAPSTSFVVSSSQFDQMLPPSGRSSFYSYSGFLKGAQQTGGFCTTGTVDDQKRECAAFFANASHETGGGQYITEIAKGNYCDNSWNNGCDVSALTSNCSTFPNDANGFATRWYGRGWLQLSWNGNYASASHFALGASSCAYVTNPSILGEDNGSGDAASTTQASLWYWMTQNGPFTKSAHAGITTDQSFGETIKSINGALECPSLGGTNTAQRDHRIQLYNSFISILGAASAGSGSTSC